MGFESGERTQYLQNEVCGDGHMGITDTLDLKDRLGAEKKKRLCIKQNTRRVEVAKWDKAALSDKLFR